MNINWTNIYFGFNYHSSDQDIGRAILLRSTVVLTAVTAIELGVHCNGLFADLTKLRNDIILKNRISLIEKTFLRLMHNEIYELSETDDKIIAFVNEAELSLDPSLYLSIFQIQMCYAKDCQLMGKTEIAYDLFMRAMPLLKKIKADLFSEADYYLGFIEHFGETEIASAAYQALIPILEEIQPNSYRLAISYYDLAAIKQKLARNYTQLDFNEQQKEAEEFVELYKKSLALFETIKKPNSFPIHGYVSLGLLYSMLGMHIEAKQTQEKLDILFSSQPLPTRVRAFMQVRKTLSSLKTKEEYTFLLRDLY